MLRLFSATRTPGYGWPVNIPGMDKWLSPCVHVHGGMHSKHRGADNKWDNRLSKLPTCFGPTCNCTPAQILKACCALGIKPSRSTVF